MNKNKLIALMALAIPFLPAGAQAADYTYRISALNIAIGKAQITIDDPAGNYHIGLHGQFTGLAALFGGGKGDLDITGHQDGAMPAPLLAEGTVAWGEKPRHTHVEFVDGTPTVIDIQKPYNYNPKKRHPLDPATLTEVIDPLTAMLRPMREGQLDCTARARVFDGKERYDLQFSPTGDPMTCTIQPVNVSGYDRKYDGGEPPRPLKVSFVPIADGAYAIPGKIIRDLMIGRLTIELVN